MIEWATSICGIIFIISVWKSSKQTLLKLEKLSFPIFGRKPPPQSKSRWTFVGENRNLRTTFSFVSPRKSIIINTKMADLAKDFALLSAATTFTPYAAGLTAGTLNFSFKIIFGPFRLIFWVFRRGWPRCCRRLCPLGCRSHRRVFGPRYWGFCHHHAQALHLRGYYLLLEREYHRRWSRGTQLCSRRHGFRWSRQKYWFVSS